MVMQIVEQQNSGGNTLAEDSWYSIYTYRACLREASR